MFDENSALRLLGMRLKNRALIGPETVQIDLTDNCVCNCIGCWARSPFLRDEDHYDTLDKGTLDSGFVLDLLPELAGIGVRTIFLGGGGDPLCHPDFLAVVRKIKELGLRCVINTNFINATPDLIRALVFADVDELTISLWAAEARTYSKLHPNQSEGTFLHLENMIRFLRETKKAAQGRGPIVKIYNVILSLNYRQIPDMISHASELGVEEVEFSIFDPIPRRTQIFLLQPGHIEWIDEFFSGFRHEPPPVVHRELFLRRLHNIDALKGVYDNGIVESIPCAAGWFYARVTTMGQVHSCLKAHRIASGDLKMHRFGQIWYGEGQDRFRKNTLKLKYDNPFMKMIGHDIDFALPGCYRICDNLGHNQHIMRMVGGLTNVENECLDAMEAAAKAGATIENLRAIHADFEANRDRAVQAKEPPVEIGKTAIRIEFDHPVLVGAKSLPGAYEKLVNELENCAVDDPISIPVEISNLARLPKILALIEKHTGRSIDKNGSRFAFSPLSTAPDRVGPFLKSLETTLRGANLIPVPDTDKIIEILGRFSEGLARHCEKDLLRTLGVICNEQLIGPRTFHLDVSNGCNTDCVYCWFHSPLSKGRADAHLFDTKWKAQRMPWSIFTALVDDLAKVGCSEDVVLSGKGEPLTHPRIADMLSYIREKRLNTTLFTNGLKLSEKIVHSCIENQVEMVYVSLSAANEETFKSLQTLPDKNAFERVKNNIRKLTEEKKRSGSELPKLVLVDVLCNINVLEIVRFAQLGIELGVDLLRYQLAAIEPYNRELAISPKQFDTIPGQIQNARVLAEKAGIEVIVNIDAQLERNNANWSGAEYLEKGCLAGWAFSRAWATGELSFCCSPKPIGNLAKRSFKDWWESAEYDTYRLAARHIGQNKELTFADGTKLWTDICTRCPNYEGIGHLEAILQDLGLTRE